jgi:hypothetical protein
MPMAGLWLAVSLYLARHPRVRAGIQAAPAMASAPGDAPAR